MALGPYPELSLANARKKAVEAREMLAQSIDPKAQRNELKQARLAEIEHTFENVTTAWFELKKDYVTPAYAEDIWRSLTRHVLPSLKTTPLANHRSNGHQAPSPNRSQRQSRDSEAVEPTAQRNHDLRGQFRTDLCDPPQWHWAALKKNPGKRTWPRYDLTSFRSS
jgi:hypothetical protein